MTAPPQYSPQTDCAGAAGARTEATLKLVATAVAAVSVPAVVMLFAVAAEAQSPPAGAVSCSGCHPASTSVASPVPRIIGRDRAEMLKALQEFRSGQRAATVMDRIAKGFTDAELEALASWFAAQK